MSQGKQKDEILTTKEAMKYLKITKPTILKYIRENKLRASKIGRNWRFYKSDIDRFMRECSNF